MAIMDREVELFGAALDKDDMMAELDALEAEDEAAKMGDEVGAGVITSEQANKYREDHGIVADPVQEEEPAEAAP